MKLLKKIAKWFLIFLLIPVSYFVIALIFSAITINKNSNEGVSEKLIYLSTNGVHLEIILPEENIDSLLLSDIKHSKTEKYLSFGWGEENFYLNTPTWNDLTFGNGFRALFLKSSTLIHLTRYEQKRNDWIEIKVSEMELKDLNSYIFNSFKTNNDGSKIMLENKGYSINDDFYKAKGNYSCFKTCNSWVNSGFKQSGLKSCLWTPFDFGLMNKYK